MKNELVASARAGRPPETEHTHACSMMATWENMGQGTDGVKMHVLVESLGFMVDSLESSVWGGTPGSLARAGSGYVCQGQHLGTQKEKQIREGGVVED